MAVATGIDETEAMSQNKCMCRRSELPIYTATKAKAVEDVCPHEPNLIERLVRKFREQIVKGYDKADELRYKSEDFVHDTIATAEEWAEFLQAEDNTMPRYGAIALGGLAGLILGLRGGFIRKTLYTAMGAGAMASVCYPKEARQYSQIAIQESRKYAAIAYNFAYGVKKGDPVKELPSLPKLPGSLSEAWEMASGLTKSSKESNTPKEPESSNESKSLKQPEPSKEPESSKESQSSKEPEPSKESNVTGELKWGPVEVGDEEEYDSEVCECLLEEYREEEKEIAKAKAAEAAARAKSKKPPPPGEECTNIDTSESPEGNNP